MTKQREVSYRELTIGKAQRRLFIIDGVIGKSALHPAYEHFLDLPYFFADSDREDTGHVKHLVYYFNKEDRDSQPLLHTLSCIARNFLSERGIRCGKLSRTYANFNLFGDFQFAHEDGEGWTALVFMNEKWHADWGGEFLAYDDEKPIELAFAIPPKARTNGYL